MLSELSFMRGAIRASLEDLLGGKTPSPARVSLAIKQMVEVDILMDAIPNSKAAMAVLALRLAQSYTIHIDAVGERLLVSHPRMSGDRIWDDIRQNYIKDITEPEVERGWFTDTLVLSWPGVGSVGGHNLKDSTG